MGEYGYHHWYGDPSGHCFLRQTLIATPASGEVPVGALAIGDRVVTMTGAKTITWIGRQTRLWKIAPYKFLPVRIKAGTLGGGLPKGDLWLSQTHRLLVDNVACEAQDLRSEDIQVVSDGVDDLEYVHLMLEQPAMLIAEGVPCESLVFGCRRALLEFDNWYDYVRRYGIPYAEQRAA
jgi:hypothetical protein